MSFLFALALVHGVPAAAAGDTTVAPAAKPAAAVVDRFHKALKSGDGKTALALMDDHVVVFESGGSELSKGEYQAMHLDADMEFVKGVNEVVTRRLGDARGNVAWIASEGRTSGDYHGKAVDRATTETMVLKRTPKGAWKIVHIHWSSGSH